LKDHHPIRVAMRKAAICTPGTPAWWEAVTEANVVRPGQRTAHPPLTGNTCPTKHAAASLHR
jgi:hypothetical protein